MKTVVVDASVVVKWIFPEEKKESDLSQALQVLQAIKQGAVKVLQPPHWLAEVMSVIVRLQPNIAIETVTLLKALEFPIMDIAEVYQLACRLSQRLNHHLFDTLYHAAALYEGKAQFVTADEQYYRKAAKQGAIIRLAEFSILND